MKRLLLAAVMVLVALVGMVGFSSAADKEIQTVVTQLQDIQQTLNAISKAVSALQARANPTTGAVTDLPETVNAGVQVKPKGYFLTKNSFIRADANTACDSGFHMASISEIQDASNLEYANRSTAAYDSLVDGQRLGPPSDNMGWVRTGSFPLAGVPDYCNLSMSSFDQQSGTTVSFHAPMWGDSYMDPSSSDPTTTWQMAQLSFSLPEPVWCVEDPD